MLFPQEEAPAVKQWLVRELEPLCDADPDVLADYVLALFKNDSNESEHVAILNEQLADSLEQHTQAFCIQDGRDTQRARACGGSDA